ncbi:hypothetical protein V6N13_045978 [Hibiscus sabdariffa]|uniref:Uncharacterized protein n=2 Tax=Hibiscus sabdariffa TaxID=183260 RepID=A0ABR2ARH2_9ROSI
MCEKDRAFGEVKTEENKRCVEGKAVTTDQGTPIVESEPDSAVSEAYHDVARKVVTRLDDEHFRPRRHRVTWSIPVRKP